MVNLLTIFVVFIIPLLMTFVSNSIVSDTDVRINIGNMELSGVWLGYLSWYTLTSIVYTTYYGLNAALTTMVEFIWRIF